MTDDLDETLRAAAKAHESLAPEGYFDQLEARVLDRLDREAEMMSDTDHDPAGPVDTGPVPAGEPGAAAAGGAADDAGRSDDSGLHDIRTLARTTKQRIRRITSQHDAHDAYDESLLAASHSGLRAVALPAPASVVSLPDLPAGATATATAAAAGEGATVTPLAARRRRNLVLGVVGGVLAAAAAVVVVVTVRGGETSGGPAAPPAAGSGADTAPIGQALAEKAEGRAATGQAAAAPETGTPGALMLADDSPPGDVAAGAGAAADTAGDDVAAGDKPEPTDRAAKSDGDVRGSRAGGGGARDSGGSTGRGGGNRTERGSVGKGGKPGGDKGGKGGGDASGGDKSLEDLLQEASGGPAPTGGGGSGGAGAGGKARPEKTELNTRDIKKAMNAVAGKAQACFDQYGVAGHVKVKLSVDPSGAVQSSMATGSFAGTPTGSCVAAAAQSASFPAWDGAPMTVNYAFTIQE